MDSYFSPQFYMTLFRIYLVVRNFLEVVYSTSVKTARRALLLTYPQEYVFFSGYTTPYLAGTVSMEGPGVPTVSWIYNLETNLLTNGGAESPLKSLPWLAASIRYNGLSLYSLDDFVSEVKYASAVGAPPPAVVVGSWSLRAGIVLDNQVSLELFVITEDGEEKTVSPWSLDPIASTLLLELNQPVTTRIFEPMTVELAGDNRSVSLVNEELDELPDAANEAT
jgi:hypothetical protein